MSYQVKQSHYIDVPDWASNLKQLYWVIRVEKHSRVKRRRYYRYVFKEKLRLVETGLDQDLVNAVCRYLCELSVVSGRNLEKVMANPNPQQGLDFVYRTHHKNFTINLTYALSILFMSTLSY